MIPVTDKYKGMTDEELVQLAESGDEEAEEYIIRKYKDVVRSKAQLYFMVGADSEDIVQEGMIGIFKAIRGFNKDKETSFKTFADICINHEILTAIKRAGRMKHSPLNTSLSFSNPLGEDEPRTTLGDTLTGSSDSDPENIVIRKEEMGYLDEMGSEIFSDLELKVWNAYLYGKTYTEIAQSTGKSLKAIDNAIQRIKRKLEIYFNR